MQTRIIRTIDEQALRDAGQIIRNGGLVAFPTETVYGLGGNALLPDAASEIYAAKGRPSDNPLIIHLANAADAEGYCVTSPLFYRLAEAFSPGPITMILPKKDCIPSTVTGGLSTVAVRIPQNPIARALIAAAGVPIAAPSANTSGRPSPTTADDVLEDMNGKIDMILDGGPCDIGVESTIVSLRDDQIVLLRPGAVTPDMLRSVCPELLFDDLSMRKLADGEKPMAPGMKYRHYAPNAAVILLNGDREKIVAFLRGTAQDRSVGILADGADLMGIVSKENEIVMGDGQNAGQIAANLFAALREIDRRPQIRTVYAALPKKDGIGLAVYNRLMKASGFTVIDL